MKCQNLLSLICNIFHTLTPYCLFKWPSYICPPHLHRTPIKLTKLVKWDIIVKDKGLFKICPNETPSKDEIDHLSKYSMENFF